ncbi:hypothetical protein O181_002613 [Austropuccinia psidii MF-1]|uniref:Uncharacterized protein n=1 Tax=Austropuccinia psidii MF-1 TaxID=1389203 RepID=A0A9Q3BD24_9BASI|nr:hypothetical protein [Austropuccinia psidii MF-1]
MGSRGLEGYLKSNDKINEAPQANEFFLTEELYLLLLAHATEIYKGCKIHNPYMLPHPPNSLILQLSATSLKLWIGPNPIKVIPIAPYNCIVFHKGDHIEYGLVQEVLRFNNPLGGLQTTILICLIINRFAKDLNSPSKKFQFLCCMIKVIIGEVKTLQHLICPSKIISNAAS